ncbi:MAG: universal stress protein [Cyanobacteria bacterium HKST-UBA02]|nr:universal stress protein [Cyanobacteria bacterium HKST-UBA02]
MKVLIALQDSDCLDALSGFVLKYPWPPDTTFKVMHVVQPVLVNSYMSLVPSALTEPITEERWRAGKKLVRDFALKLKDAWHTPNVEEYVEEGDTRLEIEDQISKWQPDALVLGSHSKHGLESLGSVSRGVVSAAPCSVMIVPLCAEREKKAHDRQRNKLHIIV